MIHVDPQDGVPIYRQVIEQVKLLILTGQLAPGEQLESVSSLAARLKVNPMTISKAYGFLVEEGTVIRRKGIGIFVGESPQDQTETDRQELLSQALSDAAALAVQMNISHSQAMKIFKKHLSYFDRKKGTKS